VQCYSKSVSSSCGFPLKRDQLVSAFVATSPLLVSAFVATSPLSVRRLYSKYGNQDVSQPCVSPMPLTGTALLFKMWFYLSSCGTNKIQSKFYETKGFWDLAGKLVFQVKVKVTLRLTLSVSQYVLVSGTLLGPMTRFYSFLSFAWKIAMLFVLGRPLSREDGSVICSAICQWSESPRTHNRTLLSRLRLLGSLSVASYDSQGLRWKYSYPPPHGVLVFRN
jgi:hypothetical protein